MVFNLYATSLRKEVWINFDLLDISDYESNEEGKNGTDE